MAHYYGIAPTGWPRMPWPTVVGMLGQRHALEYARNIQDASLLATYLNHKGGKRPPKLPPGTPAEPPLEPHEMFTADEMLHPIAWSPERIRAALARVKGEPGQVSPLAGLSPEAAEGVVRAQEAGLIPREVFAAELAPVWLRVVTTAERRT
jgi:hypothetical protein